jgi:SAM-dependent methyltransferase
VTHISSVTQHYESHLAPVYVWMMGGLQAAIARGQTEVAALHVTALQDKRAIDLGAGFGMHSIPLADAGYAVMAIDSSEILLEVLRGQQGARAIQTVRDDLVLFRRHIQGTVALILCMGDTLTHLPDLHSAEQLLVDVAKSLDRGGVFIATFRDYSTALSGVNRFISVRADPDRMLTCFLEYEDETLTVYDILNERDGFGWNQRVSAYQKLRLSTDWVVDILKANGLQVTQERGLSGMAKVVATRAI